MRGAGIAVVARPEGFEAPTPRFVICAYSRFRIHTNWTNTVQNVVEISLEDLADDRKRRILKWAFSETDVEQLKPNKTHQELTEEVAAGFAQLAAKSSSSGACRVVLR